MASKVMHYIKCAGRQSVNPVAEMKPFPWSTGQSVVTVANSSSLPNFPFFSFCFRGVTPKNTTLVH